MAGMAVFFVSLGTTRWILSDADEFDSVVAGARPASGSAPGRPAVAPAPALSPPALASLASPPPVIEPSSPIAAGEASPASVATLAASAAPAAPRQGDEIVEALVALNVADASAGHPQPPAGAGRAVLADRDAEPPIDAGALSSGSGKAATGQVRSASRQASTPPRPARSRPPQLAAKSARTSSRQVPASRRQEPIAGGQTVASKALGATSAAARGGLQQEEILAILPMRRASANRRRCSDAIVSLGLC